LLECVYVSKGCPSEPLMMEMLNQKLSRGKGCLNNSVCLESDREESEKKEAEIRKNLGLSSE